MNRILRIINIVYHVFFKCNTIKTLYLNFKVLPLIQAIKFPFWIYGKITFRSLKGKVLIDSSKIYSGMIKIGKNDYYVCTEKPQSIWTINGVLKFKGRVNILQGSYILVAESGVLEIGTDGTFIGSNCKIICFDKIIIGNQVEITWEVQLYDTSFHYIEHLETKNISYLTKPIVIGDNCWIGNRTTISKGAYLPNYSIVASNSLVNKNLLSYGMFSMFAGSPIDFKMKCKRIYDREKEKELDLQYNYDRTHL